MQPVKIKKRESVNSQNKITVQFDVSMLNALIKYTRCEFVSQSQMINLYKFMKRINIDSYNYNQDIQIRLKLIKLICDATIDKNIKDENLIKAFIIQEDIDVADFLKEIDISVNQLTSSECGYISSAINERLQCMYIYEVKDDIIHSLEQIDSAGFTSYRDIVKELKLKLSTLMVNLQNANASNGLLRSFCFSDEEFASLVGIIVAKAQKPASILQTGIRQLNAILSPGFQSGRLYMILGGTGKFKSGTLLNLADQIRLYNPQVVPFENGMRKTILFITMENSIEETVVRLYDMYSDVNDDLSDKSPEDVIKTLRENGKFVFTDNTGIDIEIRYYANLEINTAHIYTLIRELADLGKDVICVMLDYIKRIDSTHDNGGDERLRLSYASKELKSLAQFFEIPVITAMQINREGNSIIDAAMRENKQDVAQFVGTSSVGNCWDIIEESDWVCLINLEMQKSTNQLFLTFKRLKIRGKKDPLAVDYFNHPFVNEKNIRLQVDVDKESPVSIISLASDLESIDEKEMKDARKEKRPRVSTVYTDSKKNKILGAIESIQLPNMMAS